MTEQISNQDNVSSIVAHTINVASHVVSRDSLFYGSPVDGKSQAVPYEVWRYEVSCLQNERQNEAERRTLQQSVRFSLKSQAAKALIQLGPRASLSQQITHLDSIYGHVESAETVLQRFYSARQTENETVTEWSCRLEDLIQQAWDQGSISSQTCREQMLIAQLWSGIASPRLQCATRHTKQLMGSFNEFQREVRVVENQIGLSGASSRAQAHQGQVSVSELEKLRGTMHSLEKKRDRMSG